MYLQHFLFLDGNSTASSSPLIVNSKGGTLKLSVEKLSNVSVDITVKGKIDKASSTFFDIAVFKLADFSTITKINDEGLYAIDVNGISEIKLVNNGTAGSVKALGVVVDG